MLDEEWAKMGSPEEKRWKHPDWHETFTKVVDEVYLRKGIPRRLLSSVLEADSSASQEENDSLSDEELPKTVAAESISEIKLKDEHFEPLTVPQKWQRLQLDLPPLELDLSKTQIELLEVIQAHQETLNECIRSRLTEWVADNDPDRGGLKWAYRKQMIIPASQYSDWDAFLQSIRASELPFALPNISIGWDIQFSEDWLEPGVQNLFIALENTSNLPSRYKDETDEAIYQVSLDVEIPSDTHTPLKLERIEPSYRYNQYLHYPAMGHNGGVTQIEANEGKVVLQTTWTPRYVQPRIVPSPVKGVLRVIRELAKPKGFEGLNLIIPEMESWIDSLPDSIDPTDGLLVGDETEIAREQHAFQEDLVKWKKEKDSIAAGIKCLEESRKHWRQRGPQSDKRAIPFEAWLAMNEAIADFMQSKFNHDTGEWRLFQLAFIVANIPAIISRMPEYRSHYDQHRDDVVTLLYFSTGGGKSEAFFGLLVFNLIFDRLRGKTFGVTSLIRYPLRLLTIQQAQRCSRVLAFAELVRCRYKYGGEKLSIGFWVGGGGSPNYHKAKGVDAIPTVEDSPPTESTENALCEADPKYNASRRAWLKLPACPFCMSKTALRIFRNHGDKTLGHVCTDIECPSNQGTWKALPFYIVDEDIYSLAPSVLLGTVDKLALIGHSSRTIQRILGMFGAAPWLKASDRLYVPTSQELEKEPDLIGMKRIYPAYKDGLKIFTDPFPSLIIQDEAHLLDESLGTFAGLFESTLDTIFEYLSKPLAEIVARDSQGNRRRAKVVAASATVAEPQRQLEHLYQRPIPATQFPEPGPKLYQSFYAQPDISEDAQRRSNDNVEIASHQARIYTAFMTNGKPHTSTSVAILSSFHFTITKLFDSLTSNDPHRFRETQELLVDHVSKGSLNNEHTASILDADKNALATIIDLHRIALTYVTNKKGGDQIMAAEAEETRKQHANESIPLDSLETKLITGSVEQGEIQSVVTTAQHRVNDGEPLPPIRDQLRSVIATSAISHGVDVDEFNSMFFAGLPTDIAEYIQASSRVGRTHIGFVVLIPTPQRRRDRHVVHIFDIFHRFLERMVQPAAIDRWAEKAIERVFPSLLQAYLLGVVPSCEALNAGMSRSSLDLSMIPNVRREYLSRGDGLIDEISEFINSSLGLTEGYAPEGEEHYRRLIDNRIRRLIGDTWSSNLYSTTAVESFFKAQVDPILKPMTSLRDVDQGGVIQSSFRDMNGKRQKSDEIQLVMDLIRHGVSNNQGSDNDLTET